MAAPSMKGVFGGGDSPPPMGEEPDADEPEKGESEPEYPPEYDSAYDEWESNPSKETMWRMIDACANGGGGGGGKSPGLAVLIGNMKGKKK